MLFEDAVSEYMADKSRRLRATTLAGYESAIRCHLMPMWAGRELESIGLAELQGWVDSIALPGAARKAYKTFRQVYRWACRRHGLRVWDVTQGVELPRLPDGPKRALAASEERETLRGIAGQEWEAVVLLAAALGLRRCEACGMRWEDVDWRSGLVTVSRGLHWVGGREVVEPPKTRLAARTLRLPRWALERLRAIRGTRRNGRVCELPPHRVAARFRSFCRRNGLPWVPLGCLRHSWATIALEAGAAIEDVSVALGHSTVDTCIRHYLQSFTAVVGRASDAYSRAMLAG